VVAADQAERPVSGVDSSRRARRTRPPATFARERPGPASLRFRPAYGHAEGYRGFSQKPEGLSNRSGDLFAHRRNSKGGSTGLY